MVKAFLRIVTVGFVVAAANGAEGARLEFNRDVRPILSDKCFKCHGPDSRAREAKLRLDLRSDATAEHGSGATPIVPGKPDESELVARINAKDADEQMPPPDSNITLLAAEKAVLRQWIAEGAEYQPHWSLLAPKAAALPAVRQTAWPRNEIDRFILARLEKEKLAPSPEA